MDGLALGFFLLAAFLGGLASGIAGFCHGLRGVRHMAAHHHADPDHNTDRRFRSWTQGYGVWKLRHTLNWRHEAPFIIGGAIGVPIGTMLLTSINPAYLRTGVEGLLVSAALRLTARICRSGMNQSSHVTLAASLGHAGCR